MTKLTRRAAFRILPMLGAAVAVPAVAVGAEVVKEHAWDKVRRLARELSHALDDVEGGSEFAMVYPRSHPDQQTLFGSIDAYEQTTRGIRPTLSGAIAHHRTAWQALEDCCNDIDEVYQKQRGKTVTRRARRIWDRRSAAEAKAIASLCGMVCINMTEERTRAAYLAKHFERNQFEDSDANAFLWSVAGETV